MASSSVLRVNDREEQDEYLAAVAEILRMIQNDNKVTLIEISEKIDVSLGTVSNAANKKGVLGSIYLNRLGRAYGVHVLDPYLALAGGRAVAREPEGARDLLPRLTLVGHNIAVARSEGSPGGARETLQERLAYLPELRRLSREVAAEICQIERERDAA